MLCFGVDGNRNYAYNWLVPDETGNAGGSTVPCTDTFGEFYAIYLMLNSCMSRKELLTFKKKKNYKFFVNYKFKFLKKYVTLEERQMCMLR